MAYVFLHGVRSEGSTGEPLVPAFLLVEDDRAVLFALARRLSEHAPVVGVMSVTEALAVIDENPRLRGIVVDWKLPDGVGGTVVEHAKRRTRAPILIITGCDESDPEEESWRHGARFLRKPVSEQKLVTFAQETEPARRRVFWTARCAAHARLLAHRWNLTERLTEILVTAPHHHGDPTETYNALARGSPRGYSRGTFNNQVHLLLEMAREHEDEVFLSLQSLVAWMMTTADL